MGTTYAHFVITGEFLTDHARNLVLDERFNDAVNTLQELEGIELNQIILILNGDYELTGDSDQGIGFEEDNSEESKKYKEHLRKNFAGIFKKSEKYYKPYKWISNYGPADMYASNATVMSYSPLSTNRNPEGATISRALHYGDPFNDHACIIKNKYFDGTSSAVVLFKKVVTPPFFIKTFINEADAFENYIEIFGTLYKDGFHQTYGDSYQNFFDDPDYNAKKLKESTKNSVLKKEVERLEKENKDLEENILKWKEEIVEQAKSKGGFIKFQFSKVRYKIPKNPFIKWSCKKSTVDWDCIAPQGLKMLNDDPYHTDWMIGAGFDITEDPYMYKNEKLKDKIWKLSFEIAREYNSSDCQIISGNGIVYGQLYFPSPDEEVEKGKIICIPNLSPKYYIPAITATDEGKVGGIICKVGGEMAHLSIEGKKLNMKIVRFENYEDLENDEWVTLDLNKASITRGNY